MPYTGPLIDECRKAGVDMGQFKYRSRECDYKRALDAHLGRAPVAPERRSTRVDSSGVLATDVATAKTKAVFANEQNVGPGVVATTGSTISPGKAARDARKQRPPIDISDEGAVDAALIESLLFLVAQRLPGDEALIPSSVVAKYVDEKYWLKSKVVDDKFYCSMSMLMSRAFALKVAYTAKSDIDQSKDILRFLDIKNQIASSGMRKEVQEKKMTEVAACASTVTAATASGRFEAFCLLMNKICGTNMTKTEIGCWVQDVGEQELRATTVGDVLAWRRVPPFLSTAQYAKFIDVLKEFDVEKKLFDVQSDFGSSRVDLFIALDRDIAVRCASLDEFRGLERVVDYMVAVHVKSAFLSGGPGFGSSSDKRISSGQAIARRMVSHNSSIARGAGALKSVGDHFYAPSGVADHLHAMVGDGLVARWAPLIESGKFAVGVHHVVDSYREMHSEPSETRYSPAGAAAGHVFAVEDGEVRDGASWREQDCPGSLAAGFLAAALNVGGLFNVARPVRRDVLSTLPTEFVVESYNGTQQIERAQHAIIGPALSFSTNCVYAPSEQRHECSTHGDAYDSRLLSGASPIYELNSGDVDFELKTRTFHAEKARESMDVVHGKARLVAANQSACAICIGFDGGPAGARDAVDGKVQPLSLSNLAETLKEIHEVHKLMAASARPDEVFFDFLGRSTWLKRVRGYLVAVSDVDSVKTEQKRFDFSKPRNQIQTDLRAALRYCLDRRQAWLDAPVTSTELAKTGPRVRPKNYFDLAISPGVADDARLPAASEIRVPLRFVGHISQSRARPWRESCVVDHVFRQKQLDIEVLGFDSRKCKRLLVSKGPEDWFRGMEIVSIASKPVPPITSTAVLNKALALMRDSPRPLKLGFAVADPGAFPADVDVPKPGALKLWETARPALETYRVRLRRVGKLDAAAALPVRCAAGHPQAVVGVGDLGGDLVVFEMAMESPTRPPPWAASAERQRVAAAADAAAKRAGDVSFARDVCEQEGGLWVPAQDEPCAREAIERKRKREARDDFDNALESMATAIVELRGCGVDVCAFENLMAQTKAKRRRRA